jgi:hypothetical protein
MINIGCHISFKWATKFGCTCRKNALQDPIRSFAHSIMGPYTITKAMGDNSFELNIPPFLGLHPVFNVDLLRPYFPPLLDTSDVAEKMTPTELNPDCIQNASNDHIVDTNQGHSTTKDPTLSSRQSRAAPAPRQVAHLGPNSTEISSSDGGTQCNGDHCFLRRED